MDKYNAPGVPDGFLELPARVYAGDPMWIPEDPAVTQEAFSSINPWFSHGIAQTWCRPGRARVAAFFAPSHCVGGEPAAFFGYWETLNDRRSNVALFHAVETWAAEQGAEVLYGPINFTTYGLYRLRVEAEWGAVTFPGEPYNPPYYPALLESLGFVPHENYVTTVVTSAQTKTVRESLAPKHKKVLSLGYRFAPLDVSTWVEKLPLIHRLIDNIFGENLAYTPLSFESFSKVAGASFVRRSCPITSVVAYGPQGDIAGFILVVPHYGPLVVAGARNDEWVSIGDLDYKEHRSLLACRGRPDVLLKTLGVAKAHRNVGLMPALIVEVLDRGMNLWDRWFPVLIRSGNRSGQLAEGMGKTVRRYVLYRKVGLQQ